MKTPNRWRPSLEVLEDRTLLSSSPVHAPPVLDAAIQLSHHTHLLILSGTVSGTWSAAHTLPDIGVRQALTGTGPVKPLGSKVQVSRQLQLPGFIRTGRATGTLTLSTSKGNVMLQLLGPNTKGFGGPVISLGYKIIRGTGQYAGASGNGVVSLSETSGGVVPALAGPRSQSFTLAF